MTILVVDNNPVIVWTGKPLTLAARRRLDASGATIIEKGGRIGELLDGTTRAARRRR